MKDIDHWKIARQFMMAYGEEAKKEAAAMAGKMLHQGNTGGFNAWKQIATAICDLERGSQTPVTCESTAPQANSARPPQRLGAVSGDEIASVSHRAG